MIGLRSRPVMFKEVFTSKVLQFQINPFITTSQLINTLRSDLSIQFGISENDLEIVEAGQYNYGIPELAPPLQPSNIKLSQKWGENLQNLAFYVRRKNYNYPEYTHNGRIIGECPICYENVLISSRYQCSHSICSCCYSICRQNGYINCPTCRSN